MFYHSWLIDRRRQSDYTPSGNPQLLAPAVAFPPWARQRAKNDHLMDIKERNILNLYREIAFFGVLSGIASTFLSIFALRLGASSQDIGLISALPALVSVTLP